MARIPETLSPSWATALGSLDLGIQTWAAQQAPASTLRDARMFSKEDAEEAVSMAELESLMRKAQDQIQQAVRAEVFEGNISKAVTLYALAGGVYVDALREVRARCTSCMGRLRALKDYATPRRRASAEADTEDAGARKPEESDSGSDDDDEEAGLITGPDYEMICHLEGVLILGKSSCGPCSDTGLVELVPKVLRLAGLASSHSRRRSRSPDRRPVRKVLLYGPSVTGKTCLASAIVARNTNATVYYVSTPVLLNRCRLRGDVVLVHSLFDDALRRSPCVLCFDDLDALCSLPKSPRDQERLRALKCAWLERVSRLPSKAGPVLVLGVINNPWLLDDDVRSQFERILFAPLPQEADRLCLLKQLVRSPALTDEDYRLLAKRTEGFTSTFLAMLAADAQRNARAVCEHVYDRAVDASGALKVTLSDILTSMEKVELPESVSRRSSVTSSKTESTTVALP
ncbi:vacuolar protein sorting-associated protein 4-like [Dermacentor albipictus]|uniref:vacuolar protein sorting-associated protein 4-like n=1 Tax=Dermacentor albipictus TaxID=60249 RepID=UPI0038FD01E5